METARRVGKRRKRKVVYVVALEREPSEGEIQRIRTEHAVDNVAVVTLKSPDALRNLVYQWMRHKAGLAVAPEWKTLIGVMDRAGMDYNSIVAMLRALDRGGYYVIRHVFEE